MAKLQYIVHFDDISKEQANSYGDKAAYLAELQHMKIRIPEGFIISPDVFHEILSQIKPNVEQIINSINFEDFNSIQAASEQIRNQIFQAQLPSNFQDEVLSEYKKIDSVSNQYEQLGTKTMDLISSGRDLPFVSLRLSRTNCSPNQSPALLNLQGIEPLMQAVKEQFASVFSTRSLISMNKQEISLDSLNVSLVVQKMLQAMKTGDLFTINPLNNDKNTILVQAIWGLRSTSLENPSLFFVNKLTKELSAQDLKQQENYLTKDTQTGQLVLKQIPIESQSASTLTPKELDVLAELAKKVEAEFNFPQHVEWALERNNLYVLQTRPINYFFKKPLTIHQLREESDLPGILVSKQPISGIIKKVTSPEHISDFSAQGVIVTNRVNKQMLPAAFNASAIVTESTGLSSQAVLLSQELGIPCLINSQEALDKVEDNQELEINENGLVLKEPVRVEEPSSEMYSSDVHPDPHESSESKVYDYPESQQESERGLSDIARYLQHLEKYFTDQVYQGAQKRREGAEFDETQQRKAHLLNELEWKIREIRKKFNELDNINQS